MKGKAPATDWREAGHKADAHRVRDLYRGTFGNDAKAIVRNRVTAVLRAAGGEKVLDLWGGGISAKTFVESGLQVVSVEDGSLELDDHGARVSVARKRRAFERTAQEDGYEARWGHVQAFAAECDVAFLDFCGPWSRRVRQAVESCRHMSAVAVTLMTDHDINSTATTQAERMEGYKAFLRLAYSGKVGRGMQNIGCRLLCRYTTSSGHPVWVFLLAKKRLPIGRFSYRERMVLGVTTRERERVWERAKYEKHRERLRSDLEYKTKRLAYKNEWRAANPDKIKEQRQRHAPRQRHREHIKGVVPRKPCVLCADGIAA